MALYDNLNMTTSEGVAAGVVDFYERTLLENAKPERVYARDAQKRSLPENNGKHVNFRRMVPFDPITEPLKEGVTPTGQEVKQTSFTAMVKPYGRHVEMTDEFDLYHIDNLHRETANLLSDQALLSLDTIARDALMAGLNVQYAGGNAARSTLEAGDIITGTEIKKVVRTLQRNNCKPFGDGYYHAVVHPDAVYDLTADPMWIDIAKYQDKSKVEKYELGCMYGVKFFVSTNAKKFEAETYLVDTITSLTIANLDQETRKATLSTTLTEDQARALTGKLVNVSGGETITPMCIERIDVTAKTITFRYVPEAAVGATSVVPTGGGSNDIDVYGTIIYGQNAYGDVELGGNGKNIKIIIHEPGHGEDPLEQRGTIAWKVKGYCCVILQDAYIVRLEHAATA